MGLTFSQLSSVWSTLLGRRPPGFRKGSFPCPAGAERAWHVTFLMQSRDPANERHPLCPAQVHLGSPEVRGNKSLLHFVSPGGGLQR